jgi:YD repeat-containing protein
MFSRLFAATFAIALGAFPAMSGAQSASPTPDPVWVTVSINADGSKTVYEFDALRHRATATTTRKDGKLVGKIRYTLDDAGRFASGEVYGPDEQFRFRTLYKYDDAGKLTEEAQLGQNDVVRNKIVYAYDKNGKQTGYTVYDTAGKMIRRTPETRPKPTPTPRRR